MVEIPSRVPGREGVMEMNLRGKQDSNRAQDFSEVDWKGMLLTCDRMIFQWTDCTRPFSMPASTTYTEGQ